MYLGSSFDRPPPSGSSVRRHRLDIQGLRAVAVIAVLLFHANVPISGGFLGVDIFFVISGFVITQMLLDELERAGKVNLRLFFLKRFLRLAPPLAVVSALTILVMYLFLTPSSSHTETAQTAIGASLISANLVIAQISGAYFGGAPESNALLHTWSLAVEEQFYLLFPIVIVAAWVIGQRSRRSSMLWVSVALAVSGLVSFASTQVNTFFDLSWGQFLFGYYSPLTRAWEFVIGAAVYVGVRNRAIPGRVSSLLSIAGLAMVVIAVTTITKESQTPGFSTLIPTLGTALLLIGGTTPGHFVSRALSSKGMVRVGDWSYSIYLWHWPAIFVAARIWPDSSIATSVAGAASIALAWLSWRFVETPFRRYPGQPTTRRVGSAGALVLVPILVSSLFLSAQENYWRWLDQTGVMPVAHPGDTGFAEFIEFTNARSIPCEWINTSAAGLERAHEVIDCRQSAAPGPAEIAIIGDSHGAPLFLGLSQTLNDRAVALFTTTWEGDQTRASEDSLIELNLIIAVIESNPQIQKVLVTGYWAERPYPTAEWDNLVKRLTESGRQVYFTDDVPSFEFAPDICKYGTSWVSRRATTCTQSDESVPEPERDLQQRFITWAKRNEDVVLLETRRFFCRSTQCSMISVDGKLLYRDDDHLNINGSMFLGQRIVDEYPEVIPD